MLLEIAGLSKQSYYYAIKHIDDKDNKDKFYEDFIIKIFNKNYKKYGIPRISDALNIELDKRCLPKINHKRVERIMKKLGIQARPKQRKYISFKCDFGKKCKNLLLDKNLLVDEENFPVISLDALNNSTKSKNIIGFKLTLDLSAIEGETLI